MWGAIRSLVSAHLASQKLSLPLVVPGLSLCRRRLFGKDWCRLGLSCISSSFAVLAKVCSCFSTPTPCVKSWPITLVCVYEKKREREASSAVLSIEKSSKVGVALLLLKLKRPLWLKMEESLEFGISAERK